MFRGFQFVLLVTLLFASSLHAQDFYRLNNGNNVIIKKHGICKKVQNASGKHIFIPVKAKAEWTSFISATVSGVTKSNCSCTCPDFSVVTLGAACSGGGICAGTYLGEKYMITPGNCTDSATPTCNGAADTMTKIWRGSTGSNTDIPAIDNIGSSHIPSVQLGDVTTAAAVAHASVSSDSAADYCNDMVYGGHSDWYLPSKSEMAYMYCNAAATSHAVWKPEEYPGCGGDYGLSDALPGFTTSAGYWTSTESTGTTAWTVYMSGGSAATAYNKNISTMTVRCVRRYQADPCNGVGKGSAATGGAICAGTFKGRKYMMTPGACTDSATPTCSGSTDTITKRWKGSSGSDVDIVGVENISGNSTPSTQLGDGSTSIIANHTSISSDSAANYCESIVYGGYDDWYLPSKTELTYLFCNSNVSAARFPNRPHQQPDCAGDFNGPTTLLTGFTNDGYWSSTEVDSNSAWQVNFNTGEGSGLKSLQRNIRCVRSYN